MFNLNTKYIVSVSLNSLESKTIFFVFEQVTLIEEYFFKKKFSDNIILNKTKNLRKKTEYEYINLLLL